MSSINVLNFYQPTLFSVYIPTTLWKHSLHILMLFSLTTSATMSLGDEWDGSEAKMNQTKFNTRVYFISLLRNINEYIITWLNIFMQL